MNNLTQEYIKGYKPVTHRGCGGQLAWVKEHVRMCDRFRSDELLKMDGSPVIPNAPLDLVCGRCEQQVASPRACAI